MIALPDSDEWPLMDSGGFNVSSQPGPSSPNSVFLDNEQRKCSVRGCSHPIDPSSSTKMCETCRGRHRIYASTKRARRKLEKAAIVGIRRDPEPEQVQSHTWAPLWDNSAIDPQLFHEPVLHYVRPQYPPSTSSELAGALTLPEETASYPQPPKDEEERQITDGDSTVMKGDELKACTVKGCKAWIPVTHEYKMCTPCRTRYRTYGITKRAKWKAEREAFDRELVGLRTQEDERRKLAGEKPFAESPEDLHAWELSIAGIEHPFDHPLTSVPLLEAKQHGLQQPLPEGTRMCTVSHCHKILPASHRYKRCEQHRLQNRYHSQLKRVREEEQGKLKKGKEIAKDEETNDEGESAEEEGEDRKLEDGVATDEKGKDKPRKRIFTCATKEPACHNLLAPDVRWRHCDICRARSRVFKREKESDLGTAAELERLREIVRLLGGEAAVNGSGVGKQEEKHVVEGGVPAPAPDVVVPESAMSVDGQSNLPTDPHVNTNANGETIGPSMGSLNVPPSATATVSPDVGNSSPSLAVTPITIATSSHSQGQTFQSVFQANISPLTVPLPQPPVSTPSPAPSDTAPSGHSASSSSSSSSVSSAPGELTFREYKPKTAPPPRPGGPPTLGQGEEMFREMVQRDQRTSSGMLGPASYHVYKATPPPQSSLQTPAQPSCTSPPTSTSVPNKKQKLEDNNTSNPPSTPDSTTVISSNQPLTTATSAPAPPSASTSTSTMAVDPAPEPSPISPVIPRQRKPRSSRASAKPTSPSASAPVPPPSQPHPAYSYPPGYPAGYPSGYPSSSYSSSYPPSHYPYPYYSIPPSYVYGPRPGTSAYPYPYPYPYPPSPSSPYGYSYPYPYAPPPPGYGYAHPRYPSGYPQVYVYPPASYGSGVGSSQGSSTNGTKEMSFSYYQPPHPPPETSDSEKRKRKRGDEESEREKEKEKEKEKSSVPAPKTATDMPPSHAPTHTPTMPSSSAPIVVVPFTLQASTASRQMSQSTITTPAPAATPTPSSEAPKTPPQQPPAEPDTPVTAPNAIIEAQLPHDKL